MKTLLSIVYIFLLSLLGQADVHAADTIHHDLKVVLYPDQSRLSVEDKITLPSPISAVRFLLHRGLRPESATRGATISRRGQSDYIDSVTVKLPKGMKTFTMKYAGTIAHKLEPVGKEQARGFSDTAGMISREGVYLSSGACWYPVFEKGMIRFDMDISSPPGWEAVSQGERVLHEKGKDGTRVRWSSPEPQEGIVIAAAPFTVYEQKSGGVIDMVYLRSPDKELAGKYLNAASKYIEMYGKMIGPYPYKKFALVENFWETGFGMPSFTLLGPQVIRLPFIIDSSYPHEILHNWWGNGVFPEFSSGNWSEGLTAYLSDHLMRDRMGEGAEYRFSALQKYADYVSAGRDFPLTDFRSRHSSSSEAIGYGKALMFFHMLRLEMGDKLFIKGLREFYSRYKFRLASYADLEKTFEQASGKDLKRDFEEWIRWTGAPRIRIENVRSAAEDKGFLLRAVLKQVQNGAPYRLRIPVAVTMEGSERAVQTVLLMDKRSMEVKLQVPSKPLRIDVDPEYDVFRRLDRDEIPPAISQALGARKMLVILPSGAPPALATAYWHLSEALRNTGPDMVEIKLDRDVTKIPPDAAVAVLGWQNRFYKDILSDVAGYGVQIDDKRIRIGKNDLSREGHSFVWTVKNPGNKSMAIIFIGTEMPEAIPSIARKLPHYHKYSYLVFEGKDSVNIAKGSWPVIGSPMTVFLQGGPSNVAMGRLQKRNPLSAARISSERMMEIVRYLSGKELKGRGLGTEGLDLAAEYIAAEFRDAGLIPAGDAGSYFQVWEDYAGDPARNVEMKNVIGAIPGKKRGLSARNIVIGAHYDHLGLGWPDVREGNRGKIHPGADDNASGVAVLTELARVMNAEGPPGRSIVFAAFTGEEAGKRGSKYYVANEREYPASNCDGMINLDTVGRLGDRKLLVLDGGSAREWKSVVMNAGLSSGVEANLVPEELDSSDQRSFIEAGIPAVQLFSGPHADYHRPSDTADKIDASGLVKVASVAEAALEFISNSDRPLTPTLKPAGDVTLEKKERKVTLGTIPDFSYTGRGCRISGVLPGSPAERSGLRAGDVIVRIGSAEVGTIKEFSDVLKSLSPGDKLGITVVRDGRELLVQSEVVAK